MAFNFPNTPAPNDTYPSPAIPGVPVYTWDGEKWTVGPVTVTAPSTAYSNFVARTVGLDSAHQSAYRGLFDGLTADGLFNADGTTNYFDGLYILATQDPASSTAALLNLVSSSYPLTLSASAPAFAVDRGYTGVDASTTVYIDTGFLPNYPATNKVSLNSAHVSAWVVTPSTPSSAGNGEIIGSNDAGGYILIWPRQGTSGSVFLMNDTGYSNYFPCSDATGHWVSNRTGASANAGYRNGVLVGSPNIAATGVPGNKMAILAANDTSAGYTAGAPYQIAMASMGAGLTPAQITAFYNRLRTYMTAVGVP